MPTAQHDFVAFALAQHALSFGSFRLKSGRESPYFFNAGVFASGASLTVLAQQYARVIHDQQLAFDVLFGPAYKGIPLVTATALALQQYYGLAAPFAFNRKEAKAHGEGGQVVGSDLQGKRVLLIDDVITAGTAIDEVMPLLTQQNATLAGVVIILDRQERGQGNQSTVQQLKQEFSIPIYSIINLQDILSYARQNAGQQAHLAALQQHFSQQCCA